MVCRELNAVVMPDETLALEWSGYNNQSDQSTLRLQDEIFACFQEEPARWLLFLSFCDRHTPLSSSLDLDDDLDTKLSDERS